MLSIRKNEYILDCYSDISDLYRDIKDKKRRKTARLASEERDYSFTHTYTLDEAYNLMIHGDSKLYKEIKDTVKSLNIDKILGNVVKKSSLYNSVVGFQPNVPNFLKGIPTDMIAEKQNKKSQKILNIVINTTCSCGVNASDITKAGAYYYTIIDLLEKSGYRCNVYSMANFHTYEDDGYMLLRIKTDREPFNKEKIAFVIAHPSFQRRINFKWMEGCNCKGEPTRESYGRPITDDNKIKLVLNKELKADFIVWSMQEDYKVKIERIIEKLKEQGIKIGEE